MGFLGQDWSMGNLGAKAKGLLADPSTTLSNPLVSAGFGLLAENSKPGGGNPWQGVVGGLMSGKQQKQADEDRKRIEELRKELAALIAAQGAAMPPPQPQGMSPAGPPPPGLMPQQPGMQMPPGAGPPMMPQPQGMSPAMPGMHPPGLLEQFMRR